ncbi:MAG: DMT family transporter [Bacilli bacterium]|nr:DMT family transporter [Bacilli bacterium]
MNNLGNKNVRVWSLLGMVLVVVLWGLAPLSGKYLFNENAYTPALLIAFRGLISVVVLGIYLLISARFKKIDKSYWICLPAGLIMGLAYLLQFIGLESTTLSKNTFLESFSVIAVPLTMVILTRKAPSIISVFASLFCFLGCFVLCGKGWDFSSLFLAPTLGDVLSALAGALFGANIAFTKVFAKDKDPYVYVFFQLLIMTAISFAYALPFEKGLTFSYMPVHLLTLLFLALVCTIGCWVLRTICIKNVSAVTTAVLNPMSAVIATSLSVVLSMEEFSWNVVIGGLIITLSILISGILDAKKEKEASLKELSKE